MFKIGCQTITFGGNQNENFPQVFESVKQAGYSGVEIGFRHIQNTPREHFNKMLETAGLQLLGTHLGGNLEDPAQAEGEKEILDDVLDYLEPLGTELIMYSGLRYESDDQLDNELGMLNRAAAKCRERDVHLLYHNHNWEFQNDAKVIEALLEDGSEELGFCPDIGWVMKGGWEITEFLGRAGDRVKALHFKDFATDGDGVDTVILGRGIAPLEEAADWAKANMEGGWMIAEQDKAAVEPAEAVRQNAEFLKTLFPTS
ncbi:MAG: sugar phosphate isomerase/epimerase [Planctomycetes bacterium]|nr:sugar phosphate isomerase/epimerase [Planctomycetota bacterium]